jgi:soluble lytic murein transglycosylase-like protein
MTAYLPLIAALAGLGWVQSDPDRELTAWAVLRGVDPAVVLAVARIETGNVSPDRRDSVVSRTGDVGRMQINTGFWCPKLGLDRPNCVEWLKNRRNNYALGTAIIARIQAKYGGRGLTDCRCGGSHGGGWIAHYNGGHTVRKGSRAERYGMKVIKLINRETMLGPARLRSRGAIWHGADAGGVRR